MKQNQICMGKVKMRDPLCRLDFVWKQKNILGLGNLLEYNMKSEKKWMMQCLLLFQYIENEYEIKGNEHYI